MELGVSSKYDIIYLFVCVSTPLQKVELSIFVQYLSPVNLSIVWVEEENTLYVKLHQEGSFQFHIADAIDFMNFREMLQGNSPSESPSEGRTSG